METGNDKQDSKSDGAKNNESEKGEKQGATSIRKLLIRKLEQDDDSHYRSESQKYGWRVTSSASIRRPA